MKSRIAVVFHLHRDFSDFGVLNTLGQKVAGRVPRDCAKRLFIRWSFLTGREQVVQYLMGSISAAKRAAVCSRRGVWRGGVHVPKLGSTRSKI